MKIICQNQDFLAYSGQRITYVGTRMSSTIIEILSGDTSRVTITPCEPLLQWYPSLILTTSVVSLCTTAPTSKAPSAPPHPQKRDTHNSNADIIPKQTLQAQPALLTSHVNLRRPGLLNQHTAINIKIPPIARRNHELKISPPINHYFRHSPQRENLPLPEYAPVSSKTAS